MNLFLKVKNRSNSFIKYDYLTSFSDKEIKCINKENKYINNNNINYIIAKIYKGDKEELIHGNYQIQATYYLAK